MAYRSNEPYNELPGLPPRVPIETTRVMRRCVTASRALAELKGAGNLLPNQSILINAIPLQEAKLSSEIENIVTTQDRLFRAVVEEPGRVDPQTREVLRYRTALRYGFDALQSRPIDVDLIIELCSILRDDKVGLRDQEPVIIEDANAHRIVYTPPRGRQLIVSLLHNLVDFLLTPGDLDPLIKLAIVHYQFEAVHPFVDGNGRTGRILNILALVQAQLLSIPEQAGVLSQAAGCHRGAGLGGLAAVHAGSCGGNGPLDNKPGAGDPRTVRNDNSPLPARVAAPCLLKGTDGTDLYPALRANPKRDRCRHGKERHGLELLAGVGAHRRPASGKERARGVVQAPGSPGGIELMRVSMQLQRYADKIRFLSAYWNNMPISSAYRCPEMLWYSHCLF